MNWIDIITVILLGLSFLGGMKEGAVKQFFGLVILLVSIPVAGAFYMVVANLLTFLPDPVWAALVGFFITMAIASLALGLISLVPRKIIGVVWHEGIAYRLLGGALNIVAACISLALFVIILKAYPIPGLEDAISASRVLDFIVSRFGFIQGLLPGMFRQPAGSFT